MSSTSTANDSGSSSSGLPARKGILFLLVGIGAGYATCWTVQVKPFQAGVDELASLLGKTDDERGTVAGLESGIRALQAERDSQTGKARNLETANEEQRTAAAKQERETLEASRKRETEFETSLSDCKEARRAMDAALADALRERDEAERERSRVSSERDALAQEKAELEDLLADSVPLPRMPAEVAGGPPSAMARRAQSDDVRRFLSPLLAKGNYQPSGSSTEQSPFSFRAIREAGALDRSNPESLYHLWRIVSSGENDRSDKWPSSWGPSTTASWLQDWYWFQGGDAIPALHQAQRMLIELGPTLVWLRMLAP